MPLLDLIRSHLFRALLCTWVFTQQSIWQKSRKWGLRYILMGSMFGQMAYSLSLKICMLFPSPELLWLNSAPNKKKLKAHILCYFNAYFSVQITHFPMQWRKSHTPGDYPTPWGIHFPRIFKLKSWGKGGQGPFWLWGQQDLKTQEPFPGAPHAFPSYSKQQQ